MKRPSRLKPLVEQLEDRWVPALSASFSGSTLFLGNGTNANGTPTAGLLTITINADGTVNAGDNGTLTNKANSVPASSINIRLGNIGSTTNIDTAGNVFGGSISYFSGTGADSVTLLGGGTLGSLGGNFTLNTGNGADTVTIDDTNIGGNVSSTMSNGDDVFEIMNGANIAGSLSTSGANSVFINTFAPGAMTIGGNVNLNSGSEAVDNDFDIETTVTINGSLIVSSSNSGLLITDTLTLQGDVLANVIVGLGNGANLVTVDSDSSIGGNLVATGGSGTDDVLLAAGGSIGGNVTLVLGDGDNSLEFENGFTVSGIQFTYIGGSGIDTLNLDGQAAGARLTAQLGAGDDLVFWGSNGGAVSFLSAYLDGGFGLNLLALDAPTPNPFTFLNFS